MRADQRFSSKPLLFFEAVRLVSAHFGYSTRRTARNKESRVKTIAESKVASVLRELGVAQNPAVSAKEVSQYIECRASMLNQTVKPALMDRDRARALYQSESAQKTPTIAPLMNKQKGEKRHESYLACLVQIQVEHLLGTNFDNDPQKLAYLTDANGMLSKCFARRFDGCVPSVRNPTIVWEIKEYYGTTTFGSRVADGVYETLLDGYESKEARARGCEVQHYLFVDDYLTWWTLGKSYLCRIIDMLHTGHVDRVYFGEQVVTEFPSDLTESLKL